MSITNKVSNKSVMPGITAVPDVVDAPTIGTATAGVESATVAYTAAATGGAATSFTAISTPGSITGSSATSPITVSGLTGGTSYTFKVYGANASGTWSAVQSAASNSVTPTINTSYESIATTTLNSNTTVTFSNIPGTYAHLQLRIFGKTTRPSIINDLVSLIFNDDSTVNYSSKYLYADGSNVESGSTNGTAFLYAGAVLGSTAMNANAFGCATIDILDYANTNKFKTTRGLGGWDNNGSGVTGITSGSWRSTNAITKILVRGGEATNLGSGTTVALYGIKAAV